MTRKELAEALGISVVMVGKLHKRGMPIDDVEKAIRWRRRHLEPTRMKGIRSDTLPSAPKHVARESRVAAAPAGRRSEPPRFPVPLGLVNFDWLAPDLELRIAQALGVLAAAQFEENVQALRLFMVLIPRADRARLVLPGSVLVRLYPPGCLEVLAPGYDPATGVNPNAPVAPDDRPTEESMHFLFELQCGLRLWRPEHG